MTFRPRPMIAALLLLAAFPLFGEIIDRIVVVVDNKFIITLSDIRKARVIESAFGSDLGSDEAVADFLVEKHLVEEQIAQFRTFEIPDALVAERLQAIRTPVGVSDREIRDAVVAKLRRTEFTKQRFGQFIPVSDEELRNYYEKILIPELRLRGEAIPPLENEKVAAAVREYVILERMLGEFNDWLAELKGRATIEKIPQ